MNSMSRRSFFRLGLTASAGVAVASVLSSCSSGKKEEAAASAACANSENLSPSEQSLRQANHYVEKSADAAKTCAGCSFFTAAADGSACGSCQIYTGGPANSAGYCDSWAAKA